MSTVIVVTTVITMTVTGYTSCDDGMRCDGISASGVAVFDGACACGESFPFWTAFAVPALGRVFF